MDFANLITHMTIIAPEWTTSQIEAHRLRCFLFVALKNPHFDNKPKLGSFVFLCLQAFQTGQKLLQKDYRAKNSWPVETVQLEGSTCTEQEDTGATLPTLEIELESRTLWSVKHRSTEISRLFAGSLLS